MFAPSQFDDEVTPNEPADIRAETPDGQTSPRVQVHTELGVPVYFSPTERVFLARVGEGVSGRGADSTLKSAEFGVILARIRERCLITPVEAYQMAVHHAADNDADLVVLTPCTVIEYHPRRNAPYVISVVENARDRWNNRTTSSSVAPRYVRRVRTAMEVVVPSTEQVERLRDAARALRDAERRHRIEADLLRAEIRAASDAVTRLAPEQIRHVQRTREQVALEHATLGAVVYDVSTDDDGDEENADGTGG